jgi:predicted dehydrogenase
MGDNFMSHRRSTGASRREFIKRSAVLAGAGYFISHGPRVLALQEQAANDKLNVACIGVGGKGDSDSQHVSMHANVVAVCDVDDKTLDKKMGQEVNGGRPFEKAKRFNDFRKMFDEMGKSIDAVTVTVPDHMHALASMTAMQLGKHCYTQKPMAHDVSEARMLRLAAKQYKVATQMGNQGTASPKFREGVEMIRAGVLGAISEVHVWTNRPIWPQAPQIMTRPPGEPVPPTLHWDEWLGTAPQRDYNKAYHPFKWRGFWDFGCGALGDMACHTANLPFMALKLGHPTSIEATAGDLNPETCPSWARVHYEFPEREGMPAVKVNWYEGRDESGLVHPPAELVDRVLSEFAKVPHADARASRRAATRPSTRPAAAAKLNDSGAIIVGEKGLWYSPHDYGGVWHLLPGDKFHDYQPPTPTLPRNPKGDDEGQKMEWIDAIKGGKPALSNFDYAGMLTEFVLLGNVAIRNMGTKLEWDAANMKFPNAPQAESFLKREYRSPWTLPTT